MAALKIIILSCLVSFLISKDGDRVSAAVHQTRIVGGTEVSIDKFPYILQLRTNALGHFCGATLVAPRYVISAAHCFVSTNYKDVYVVGGANTRTDPGVTRGILKLVRHPDYSPNNMHSDIVVLKLDGDMVGRNIRAIPLCQRDLKAGDYLEISGWGQIGTDKDMSHKLRTVRAPVVPTPKCRQSYGRFVQKNMVCAYEPRVKDACGGDSGGPAVLMGQLCGVVAFGWECASKDTPGAYTNVYAVSSFLTRTMKALDAL